MDLPPDLDFLAWYFTFIDSGFFSCPHCKKEITKDELVDSSGTDTDFVICPYCTNKINRNDIEI